MSITYSTWKDIIEIIDPSRTALIVIDMQNDFCSEHGMAARWGRDSAPAQVMVPRLESFLDYCRDEVESLRIIHVMNEHSNWTNSEVKMFRSRNAPEELRYFCSKGSWGADIYENHPKLHPRDDEYLVVKHRYSAFIDSDLDLILRSQGIGTLIITGVDTNVCVESTARDGHMLDYHIIVPRDLTATSTPWLYESSLENLQRYFAFVVTSADIRQVWSQSSREAHK